MARVLYAIENGGFSGVVMPQNIVVGQQARDVAQFVATYSGRKAPKVPGVGAVRTGPDRIDRGGAGGRHDVHDQHRAVGRDRDRDHHAVTRMTTP